MSHDDPGRRAHYGGFYGVQEIERTGAPLLAVLGNCQAEATRVALTSTDDRILDSVRIPPVHEMTAPDVPYLDDLLRQLDVLVVQQVRNDYRDLPLGTSQVLDRMRPGARSVLAPNYFWSGLYPYQVLVRGEQVTDPPVVPYHDVRVLAHAAGGPAPAPADPAACRAIATESLAELQRRERMHDTVPIADVVATTGAAGGHTVDHPGNPVVLELAARVLIDLELDARPADPGRELLRSVISPLYPEVVEGLELDDEPRHDWVVNGEVISQQTLHQVHLDWYAEHPEAVQLGCRRHAALIERLGLTV